MYQKQNNLTKEYS